MNIPIRHLPKPPRNRWAIIGCAIYGTSAAIVITLAVTAYLLW